MSVYLDASVLVPAILNEPGSATVDAFFAQARTELLVSDFAAAEVASALSRLVRMRTIDSRAADLCLSAFDSFRAEAAIVLEVESSDVRLASVLVRRFELMLRAPDALHLAICRRVDAPLITLDGRLAKAAAELGVPATLLA